ncbi:MAG TPA: branched-chain amino acid ABC transporter permease [Methylomirabilota bacterium]|jgi:branched-chain amino acid transport system permease protein|nr:branched-chain amino acid ABC transporter permease [Methylomirabilota bacterium]
MGALPQHLVNGLTVGSLYALLAIGLSLTYGVLRIIHIAHGAVYMLGGMISYTLMVRFRLPPLPAIALTLAACAGVGVVFERWAYRPLRTAPIIVTLISSLGLLLMVENLARIAWGPLTQPYPQFVSLRVYALGSVIVTNLQLLVLALGLALMVALQWCLRHTQVGLATLAAVQNPRGARLCGIDIDAIALVIFAVGSGLAGLAGILEGLYLTSVDPSMGQIFGLKAFVAVVVGGLGSIAGTMLAAYLIGLLEALTAAYVSAGLRDVITFALLVLVLMVRPSGLLGRRVDRA